MLLAIASIAASRKWTALPLPLSNNAVAAAKVNKKLVVFSFMGVGAQKTWDAISNKALGLDTRKQESGAKSDLYRVPQDASGQWL